jgi:Arc/MetJ-type ribon-helix-helix transcriptional regulator
MPVTYPREIQEFVSEQISSGHFQSEEAVTLEALRLLRDFTHRHRSLQSDLRQSLDELERGQDRPLNMDDVIARGEARLAKSQEVP